MPVTILNETLADPWHLLNRIVHQELGKQMDSNSNEHIQNIGMDIVMSTYCFLTRRININKQYNQNNICRIISTA